MNTETSLVMQWLTKNHASERFCSSADAKAFVARKLDVHLSKTGDQLGVKGLLILESLRTVDWDYVYSQFKLVK